MTPCVNLYSTTLVCTNKNRLIVEGHTKGVTIEARTRYLGNDNDPKQKKKFVTLVFDGGDLDYLIETLKYMKTKVTE